MTTGTQQDIFERLKTLIPRWFVDKQPILDAILWGFSAVYSWVYDFIQYAILQARIKTATGKWLDAIAFDFFGTRIYRRSGQNDAGFRKIIIANLFKEKSTRKAVHDTLNDLTGNKPKLFEPRNSSDTGGYDRGGVGYGLAGGYGSMLTPSQGFVAATLPHNDGIPNVAGYNTETGAYTTPSRAVYSGLSQLSDGVFDNDICDALNETKACGTVIWVGGKYISA